MGIRPETVISAFDIIFQLTNEKLMLSLSSISVSSTINSATILQKAVELAAKLHLPFTSSIEHRTSEFILAYTPQGLQLLHMPLDSEKSICLLFVDFVHGKNGFRLAQNCTIKQPIARAVGIKPGFRPTILDGTAGLGADAFVLASLDCKVTMCERSPIIGALLEDGLFRAAKERQDCRDRRKKDASGCKGHADISAAKY